jgi:hypothetical protein
MCNRLLISTQALYPKYDLNKALSLAFLRLLSNGSHPKAYIYIYTHTYIHTHTSVDQNKLSQAATSSTKTAYLLQYFPTEQCSSIRRYGGAQWSSDATISWKKLRTTTDLDKRYTFSWRRHLKFQISIFGRENRVSFNLSKHVESTMDTLIEDNMTQLCISLLKIKIKNIDSICCLRMKALMFCKVCFGIPFTPVNFSITGDLALLLNYKLQRSEI